MNEHEESANESQVVICRFKAVSPRIAVASGIPAKYSRVHVVVFARARAIRLCKTILSSGSPDLSYVNDPV